MRITHFDNVGITGVACAVPTRVVRTMESKDFSEHELKRFVKGTGVKERRKAAAGQTASDLCYAAARGLMQERNVDAASIGALVFITQTPDYVTPSTAYALSYRLGLSKDCIAFDVNLGCSAFSYGVHIASSLIASKSADRVLVLIGDVFRWGYENAKDALLFGDCGSAVLVERAEAGGVVSVLKSDGARRGVLMSKDGVALGMSGEGMFEFVMADVIGTVTAFLSDAGKKANDFDYILFHQANIVMLNMLSHRMEIGMEKVPVMLDKFGAVNGSCAPLALVNLKTQGNLNATSRALSCLSCGFGAGLSWGVNAFEIDRDAILPLIETDEKWSDARDACSVKQLTGVLSVSLGGGGLSLRLTRGRFHAACICLEAAA